MDEVTLRVSRASLVGNGRSHVVILLQGPPTGLISGPYGPFSTTSQVEPRAAVLSSRQLDGSSGGHHGATG